MKSSKKIIIALVIILLCSAGILCGFLLAKNPVIKKPAVKIFAYDPGEYFVTNINGSKSLLKTDLMIEMSGKSQFKEFQENRFKVRDIIINVLRSKSYEEVKHPNIQDILKAEIKDKLKESFNIDTIIDIYFNEFVIQ